MRELAQREQQEAAERVDEHVAHYAHYYLVVVHFAVVQYDTVVHGASEVDDAASYHCVAHYLYVMF